VGIAREASLGPWQHEARRKLLKTVKITRVADWPKSVLFLAGNARAKKGNTLGYVTHYRVMLPTARLWLWEHLIEQGTALENAAN
jgi:hypothetical protein